MDWRRAPARSAANCAGPTSRIRSIHAARFERKMRPNTFDIRLLNFLQSFTLLNDVHSAQLLHPWWAVHDRIPHHVAFSFFAQPGHLPFRYWPHAPQYRPHRATRLALDVISCMESSESRKGRHRARTSSAMAPAHRRGRPCARLQAASMGLNGPQKGNGITRIPPDRSQIQEASRSARSGRCAFPSVSFDSTRAARFDSADRQSSIP